MPCKILVADQGKTTETAELMEKYKDNPLVVHAPTNATCLAENWKAAAELAMLDGAKYFAHVQDDDVVRYHYVERITQALDTFHDANTWTARLHCGHDPRKAIWFASNGPMVEMDVLNNIPTVIDGELLVPYQYFSSWALSPGVAFRCGTAFKESLDEQLTDIDLFSERTILASMGLRGDVVCDPVVAGIWLQHDSNESKRQRIHQPEQTKRFLQFADDLMDRSTRWKECLAGWADFMPNNFLEAYIFSMNGLDSRYVCDVARILYDHSREEKGPEPDMKMVAGLDQAVGENQHVPIMV